MMHPKVAPRPLNCFLKIYTDAAPGPDGVSQLPLVHGAFDAEVPRPG